MLTKENHLYMRVHVIYHIVNLKTLYCSSNQLTSLHLNDNLQELHCHTNQLTSLHLNDNLQELYCNNNKLTSLNLNDNLDSLYCNNNHLTSLHLNKNLNKLECHNNQLTSLQLNENLRTILYINNPIYEIINSDDKDIINQKLRVLNQFRYLYYSLKFKKQLRDWLWVKIREPKIREKYHPMYLIENLPDEDADLDQVLNAW